MKIVKFKNGKYGVRRFSFALMGFEFLSGSGKCWFYFQPSISGNCYFDSVGECIKVIASSKKTIKAEKKDIGKAI